MLYRFASVISLSFKNTRPGPIKQYICNFYINDEIIGVRPPPRSLAGAPETCFDAAQDDSLTECATVSFFSASKAAIDIMPTPEPIATPVPVNAQRERIESDAYIAVEELIFI